MLVLLSQYCKMQKKEKRQKDWLAGWLVGFMVFYATFNKYFSYIMALNFIGGGNWSTWRKPQTCRKSLINFIT